MCDMCKALRGATPDQELVLVDALKARLMPFRETFLEEMERQSPDRLAFADALFRIALFDVAVAYLSGAGADVSELHLRLTGTFQHLADTDRANETLN